VVGLLVVALSASGACHLLPSSRTPAAASSGPDAGPPDDDLAQLAELLDAVEVAQTIALLGCETLAAGDRAQCAAALDAVEAGLQVAEGAVQAGQVCEARRDAACRAAALATAREELPRVRALVDAARRSGHRVPAPAASGSAAPAGSR
jgi:hypothetical protein